MAHGAAGGSSLIEAEIAILNATFKKSGVHNIMCLWKNKFGLSFRLFQEPEVKINLSLKQEVDKYCLIDNFKHVSRLVTLNPQHTYTIYRHKKGRAISDPASSV
jgi:hypothetical protein